jgi:hypothetical protein
MKQNNDWQAALIKVAAVVTATPRWVQALLAAEGLRIPSEWLTWWLPASAIMGAAMAFVEGWAFAYVFAAWRNQRDRSSRWLLAMALISAGIFVVVVAPYIAASVRQVALGEILAGNLSLYIWSAAVAASTIAIVASVGYAQKQTVARKPETAAHSSEQASVSVETLPFPCSHCPQSFASQQALSAHQKKHANERRNGRPEEVAEPVELPY